MKYKVKWKKPVLGIIILSAITVSFLGYSLLNSSEPAGENRPAPMEAIKEFNADIKKAVSYESVKKTYKAGKTGESSGINDNSLIEGIIISKDITFNKKESNLPDTYYLYIRNTSNGNLKKFETTRINYETFQTGDIIFYRFSSGKNYKLVVLPNKN